MLGLYTRFRDFFVLLFQSLGWNNPLSLAYLGKFNSLPTSGSASIPPSSGSSGADGTSGPTLKPLDPYQHPDLSMHLMIGSFRFQFPSILPAAHYSTANDIFYGNSSNQIMPFQGSAEDGQAYQSILDAHGGILQVQRMGAYTYPWLYHTGPHLFDGNTLHYPQDKATNSGIQIINRRVYHLTGAIYGAFKIAPNHRIVLKNGSGLQSPNIGFPAYTFMINGWPTQPATLLQTSAFEIILQPDFTIRIDNLLDGNSYITPILEDQNPGSWILTFYISETTQEATLFFVHQTAQRITVLETDLIFPHSGAYDEIGIFGTHNIPPSHPLQEPLVLFHFALYAVNNYATETQILHDIITGLWKFINVTTGLPQSQYITDRVGLAPESLTAQSSLHPSFMIGTVTYSEDIDLPPIPLFDGTNAYHIGSFRRFSFPFLLREYDRNSYFPYYQDVVDPIPLILCPPNTLVSKKKLDPNASLTIWPFIQPMALVSFFTEIQVRNSAITPTSSIFYLFVFRLPFGDYDFTFLEDPQQEFKIEYVNREVRVIFPNHPELPNHPRAFQYDFDAQQIRVVGIYLTTEVGNYSRFIVGNQAGFSPHYIQFTPPYLPDLNVNLFKTDYSVLFNLIHFSIAIDKPFSWCEQFTRDIQNAATPNAIN